MSETARKIAGDNNKKGNRYEDSYAVYRLIELAPRVILDNATVLVKEQAGCPVDDLLIVEADRRHYHQLKDDQQISWGIRDSKLKKEFVAQKQLCETGREDFTLNVVVSHDHRKKSLDETPDELTGKVSVHHFPAVRIPSELARRRELKEALQQISASRVPGAELLCGIVQGFYLAWIESELDANGFVSLAQIVAFLMQRPNFRIRRLLPSSIHPRWEEFKKSLDSIPGLEWYVDRGYFEWFLPPRESGQPVPCDGEAFGRFIERVLKQSPASFEAFEELLP